MDDLEEQHPSKTRRVARACLQCRSRKQRCMTLLVQAGPKTPCRRCQHQGFTCSFETEQDAPLLDASPSVLAQRVVDLEARLGRYEDRVLRLESTSQGRLLGSAGDASIDPINPVFSTDENVGGPRHDRPREPTAQPTPFSMDNLDLGPPIDTLRTLRGDHERHDQRNVTTSIPVLADQAPRSNVPDALPFSLLDESEVSRMVGIYFDRCHSSAPFLDTSLRNKTETMRRERPTLLLALCCIGARFWEAAEGTSAHPKLTPLTTRLDKAISRLLLRPTTRDVHLDTVRALLLYVQWMPLDSGDKAPGQHMLEQQRHRSRYNDISAWSCMGLALRYAVVLGLDNAAVAPFRATRPDAHLEDMVRLRVLQNLVTCDWNLMLSSGLPMSSEPGPLAEVGSVFAAQCLAQSPGDLRITALVELVVLVRQATRMSSEGSGRRLDTFHLRKLNTEIDDWERTWVPRLRNTEHQHSSLPFTSLRWCRLALNSAQLEPVLSSSRHVDSVSAPLTLPVLQSLEVCINAALHILTSLSEEGSWLLQSQEPQKPQSHLRMDGDAVQRLAYAVDSTWISHTFAVAFLILCYIRGIINDDLNVCVLTPPNTQQTRAPAQPRGGALLSRVVRLALDVFHAVTAPFACHPAHDFLPAVENAAGLVLNHSDGGQIGAGGLNEAADQDLFDFLNETNADWPSIFGQMDPSWQDPHVFGV